MVFNRTDGENVLFGCGEFVPGTKTINRIPDTPNPPKIIIIWRGTDPFPPIPRGGGGGGGDKLPPVPNPGPPFPGNPGPGGVAPKKCVLVGWGCRQYIEYCPEDPTRTTTGNEERKIKKISYFCFPDFILYDCSSVPPAAFFTRNPWRSYQECKTRDPLCSGPSTGGSDSLLYPDCGTPGPVTQDPDTTTTTSVGGVLVGIEDDGGGNGGGSEPPLYSPITDFGLEDYGNLYNSFGDAGIIDIERNTNTGSPSIQNTISMTVEDASRNSSFANSFSNNNNSIYDSIYNIFDYKSSDLSYMFNTKHLDIFKDHVSIEVSYLLNNLNIQSNWNEKFITGLTIQKLTSSLNTQLLDAFDRILDINGLQVDRNYFIRKVLNHLVSGTLDQFDSTYYLKLADSFRGKNVVTINQDLSDQLKQNFALNLVSNNAMSIDVNSYSDIDTKIEIGRMRFLLSDIESRFKVETIDKVEYDLFLNDPGLFVEYAEPLGLQENNDPSYDYVSPGEGDGYYYKIQTENNQLLPLILNTEVDKSYYVMSTTRKIALDVIGEDSSYTLESSSTLYNSEFSAGFIENYETKAEYYKLDLKNITSESTNFAFVEKVTARYVKLTDIDIINEHAKTYGSKTTQLNIQYDDPFFQYADRQGAFKLSMNDINFRKLPSRRSPTGNAILTRSLPDVIILNPVVSQEDNPTGAYSNIPTELADDNIIVRELVADITFDNKTRTNDKILDRTIIWNNENAYKYGLIGITDTNNAYYTFNRSKFLNKFTESPRTSAGNLIYNILNRLNNKYSYTHLYWWDLFRRLPTKEFSKLMFSFPQNISRKLKRGSFGVPVMDYLYANGEAPTNLTEKNQSIPDPVYLDNRPRG